ncbi:MAG TPA: UrcA family protein [Caulobacteraceae bacterium]|nr:UrcA family protein [Caulobacteraceae bacterium]
MLGLMLHMLPLTAVAALGAAAVAVPAHAQPYDDGYGYSDATEVPGVTVEAPRVLGRTAIGAPIQLVSTSRVVDLSDLDLSTGWGAHEMRVRIERAARDACDQLDRDYLTIDQGSSDCYRQAVNNAMYDAEDRLGFEPAGW